MTVRRAELRDLLDVEKLLENAGDRTRLGEIIRSALTQPCNEYIAAISVGDEQAQIVAAYGMVAGALGTAALYGAVPISNRVTELLSFAAHDLQKLGTQRIVAEFPDTDQFKPYRDVLLESGYDPTGIVEDFYRDGIAMVILTRRLEYKDGDERH